MASVQIADVRKAYGATQVIHGVDIDIEDGEFVILVGPSGCGKSTLLRMIAGLENISGGEIRIGPRVVNDVPPKERDIAMVFQNYALYPHMTVADNMAFSMKLRKAPKEEIADRVGKAAAILGLEKLLDRYPRQLSGGQRQRVAMGRAIVRNPQVFLFDEPLSNLDAKLRVQMRVEIRRLQRQLGVTTVYVTHDQVEAMTMADRLVVMNGGEIEQVGTPIEIYRRPATRYVATFMGSPPMNILGAEAVAGGVRIDGTVIPVAGMTAGTAVEAGIRPEDLRIAEDGLPFRIAFVEELGATRLLHGPLAGTDVAVQVPAGSTAQEGDTVRLAIDGTALHLFDPATGRRLAQG